MEGDRVEENLPNLPIPEAAVNTSPAHIETFPQIGEISARLYDQYGPPNPFQNVFSIGFHSHHDRGMIVSLISNADEADLFSPARAASANHAIHTVERGLASPWPQS